MTQDENDLSLQQQIDIELSRYEELSKGIAELEEEIGKKIQTYDDLLNSYLNAIKIIQPKMESWRTPRREKIRKIYGRLRQKWSDTKIALRSDPSLDQDEQIFTAVLKIHYKKASEQQAFLKNRQSLIQKEISKIVLPH